MTRLVQYEISITKSLIDLYSSYFHNFIHNFYSNEYKFSRYVLFLHSFQIIECSFRSIVDHWKTKDETSKRSECLCLHRLFLLLTFNNWRAHFKEIWNKSIQDQSVLCNMKFISLYKTREPLPFLTLLCSASALTLNGYVFI